MTLTPYERIARVIHYLDQEHIEQPDLNTLARESGLSPFHFHRLFSSWAAITPKDFLQCLTLSHARNLLRQGHTVLDAALGAGLSGPGRLHDLCVSLQAASPGEIKSGGEGWTLTAGFADTPFGLCLLAESPRGICHLSFVESASSAPLREIEKQWPKARVHRRDAAAAPLAAQIFQRPRRAASTLRAFVKGSAFQVKVWQALLQVPPGKIVSYGGLAAAIGQPSAARAVGTAVGKNGLAYLIPCHRVIRETGVIGDYRWGAVRKKAILAWESNGGGTVGTLLKDGRIPGNG